MMALSVRAFFAFAPSEALDREVSIMAISRKRFLSSQVARPAVLSSSACVLSRRALAAGAAAPAVAWRQRWGAFSHNAVVLLRAPPLIVLGFLGAAAVLEVIVPLLAPLTHSMPRLTWRAPCLCGAGLLHSRHGHAALCGCRHRAAVADLADDGAGGRRHLSIRTRTLSTLGLTLVQPGLVQFACGKPVGYWACCAAAVGDQHVVNVSKWGGALSECKFGDAYRAYKARCGGYQPLRESWKRLSG